MDERSLRVLEYEKVKVMLEECMACGLGKQRARELLPLAERAMIDEMQSETTEARAVLDLGKQIPLGGIRDIREDVERAIRGATLTGGQLLEVESTISSSRRLKKSLAELGPDYPILVDAAAGIETFGDLEHAIGAAISDSGDVLDSASSALRSIRLKIRNLNSKVRETLDSIVRSPEWGKLLQDPVVSIRNGRFVVPIRSEMRGQVSGIVHDQSASGATVFMEPMSVLELNNDLRQAIAEEEAEIERILADLSSRVAAMGDRFTRTLEAVGRIDFMVGRGKLSQNMDGVRPEINEEGVISFVGARHPLLRGDVVPIDPYLGKTFNTLVITGPNTGGKTVTLKTIGLLTLMAQSGLHIPAEPGSEAAVFEQVFADIGDEQSIEQSLSTFSSHLTHIVDILGRVEGSSLVLLDELGAGTDPQEGAALAMSILERLHAAGARTVATTHYSELKVFAHTTEGMSNASVEFNVETLRPTYRLSIGVPGSSNAFAIAERLGLPGDIIGSARSHVGASGQRVEEMITTLKEEHDRAAAARSDAEGLRSRYLQLKDKYEEQMRKLQLEKAEIARKARAEADSVVQYARREAEQIIAQIRAVQTERASAIAAAGSGSSRADLDEAIRASRRDLDALRDIGRELSPGNEGGIATSSSDEALSAEAEGAWDESTRIQPGDEVEIISLGQRGVVLDASGQDEFVVAMGPMRVNVARASLRRAKPLPRARGERGAGLPREPVGGVAMLEIDRARTISSELDLRGMRVDEALDAVDKYLDDAVLSGIPRARVIHGKGTGALREAVRSQLAGDRRAVSIRSGEAGEGGDGVTVVSFQRS
ncbi:MAG: endonuclease MutS2 [Clostridia bacterium]|nr:endonuclease MutS2 [Clostridia bacterium]